MNSPFINTKAVLERYHLKASRTLKNWQESRGFPKPIGIRSGAQSLYRLADIEAWEASLEDVA